LPEKWFLQLFDSSLRSLRISVISALNIARDTGYAEIAEIRRDRREDFKSPPGLLFGQSPLGHSRWAAQIRPVCEEAGMIEHRFDNLDVDEALRVIAEGTATTVGKSFYASLVESLSGTLNTTGAWVTEYLRDTQRLRALAFWLNGEWIEDYEYDIEGSPCELVVTSVGSVIK
jgi:hypothetical protein